MNPVSASAASAAYQNHQKRSKPHLQPVQEHRPWESSQGYFDDLRKPASANTSQSMLWRQYRQTLPDTARKEVTPTQRLGSLLSGFATPAFPGSSDRSFRNDSNDSKGLVAMPKRDRGNDLIQYIQDQRHGRRRPLQLQLQRFDSRQGTTRRYEYPNIGPSQPVARSHVPQDLIEGARMLQLAGVALPTQGSQALMRQTETQHNGAIGLQPDTANAAKVQSIAQEVFELQEQPKSVNVVPEDLLESMGRLRYHARNQFENDGDGLLSEMPDSMSANVAGSNYELLAVAYDIDENRIPYSRIALAGLSGSGKTHCLRLLLTRVRTRAPTMGILEMDLSHPGGIQLKHQLQPGVHVCDRMEDVTAVLQSLDKSSLPWSLVVIEGLNRPLDTEIIQHWCQRFFASNYCVVITTRRLDIARSFLLSDPSRKDNPSYKLALQVACGFVSLTQGKSRPNLGKDAAAFFTILVHCVRRSWLNVFAEIDRTSPLAMMLLGVWAALGKCEIDGKLTAKIQQVIGSDDAIRCLQTNCLITTEILGGERLYRCPFPVLMAVQMWLVGQGALDGAFKLADAVARMEMS
ncbi:hypothetical protein M409DRAFT_55030 [Zasmidium cellare ATCC 36951]|uniref:AAA+ ATPase domain-containing protein n=1 Tax=Zasmidium cellare ATCC 36951 TaxID=1080233 RepID=A0A6A6CG73_ZASCE|nr:uncharacterized protein M409DRAFT_55030 [Zasmidium cellare ATCC 36951]KAF2166155.1 hypothetical protein M409DRAFT_55030 [Zasmidium cellare ATCC 36951]